MSAVTWRSSWSVSYSPNASADVNEQLVSDSSGGVASLPSLPLRLARPASDASVPCQVLLLWSQQPLRCHQLKLEIRCSARHVELYVEGSRRNLLGEEEQGEMYLGTFRGTKQSSSEPQLFTMSPAFKQSDRDCDVLKCLQTLRVKFVSLTGDKSVLMLQEFRCIFVPMESVATVDTGEAALTAKMAGLGLGGVAGAAPDVQMLLKGFQQTLEREMETKIARVIDTKLATLSQRLAFSEQALFQLHKKMDAKDAHVQVTLNQIQQKFSQLEDQLSQFSVVKEAEKEKAEDPDEMEAKTTEQTDDVELKEVAEAQISAEGD